MGKILLVHIELIRKSDNRCDTKGTHVVCAVVTEEFLAYTKARGNDLSTPKPQFQVEIHG